MEFIEFLYRLKNDNNSNLIEAIGLGYDAVFESKVDIDKFSLANKKFDELVDRIWRFYWFYFQPEDGKLFSNENASYETSIEFDLGHLTAYSDKTTLITFTTRFQTPSFSNKVKHAAYYDRVNKDIVINLHPKIIDLYVRFKADYIAKANEFLPKLTGTWLTYSYFDDHDIFDLEKSFPDAGIGELYHKLVKEYREETIRLVNKEVRNAAVHEIVHAIDAQMHPKIWEQKEQKRYREEARKIRLKKELKPWDNSGDSHLRTRYYNLPVEINAYIIGLASTLSDEDIDKSFNEIINTSYLKEFLSKLHPNNKKRALKRIYSIVSDKLDTKSSAA